MKRSFLKSFVFFVTLWALLLPTMQASEMINTICPVTPDEPAESYFSTVYEGKTIGFCCKSCLRKFNANPEAYLENLNLKEIVDSTGNAHEHHDTHSHDHSTDHGAGESSSSKLAVTFGKLHVIVIHLPIALLSVAGLFELVGAVMRKKELFIVAEYNFVIGAVAAILSAAMGWVSAEQSSYTGELADILFTHRWLGVSVAVMSLCGLFALIAKHKIQVARNIYRLCLGILAILVLITGHYGGSLIYGVDYL